jgi:hypothetical protein
MASSASGRIEPEDAAAQVARLPFVAHGLLTFEYTNLKSL